MPNEYSVYMSVEVINKQTQVLNTALQLFVKQGLQQTSMAQISKESGVAVGTMYHYFQGKDELIEALFLHAKQQFAEAVHLNEVENTLSYKSKFELIWHKSYFFYTKHYNLFTFKESLNYSPIISQKTRKKANALIANEVALIQEGLDKGLFREIPLILAMRFIHNSVNTLVQIKIANEIEVAEDMIANAIKMTWNGLAK